MKLWSLKGVHKESRVQSGDIVRLKVKYTQLAHDKVMLHALSKMILFSWHYRI